MSRPVVAIDGPSGSGKSSVGRALAERLGLDYVDSGAFYRAVALHCLRQPDPEAALSRAGELARRLRIESLWDGRRHRLLLDGEDVSQALREPEVERWASRVAVVAEVRQEISTRLRALGRHGGLVMEGRDIGSVVLPEADLKVFLDAGAAERARRRAVETARAAPEQVAEELERRDRRDASRELAPLRQTPGALVLDSTELTLEEVVERLVRALTA